MFINVHEYHTYDLQQHQKTTIQTIFSRTHSPSTCPVRHALYTILITFFMSDLINLRNIPFLRLVERLLAQLFIFNSILY